jgi:L-aspartate oxidase
LPTLAAEPIDTEYLIIGTGVAGLMLALKLAKKGPVCLIAKGELTENNSFYAQGGIASVLSGQDSFADHIQDTLVAGAGLCHASVVRKVVESGPEVIRELVALGVQFTKVSEPSAEPNFETLHLSREGGHSQRRVVHAEDLTGRELIRALTTAVRSSPNITVYENQMAVDLITTDKVAPNFAENRCLGAYVFNGKNVVAIRSDKTFLCTGGHGKAYLYTTNPDSATGDGLAMAWRAGCRIANLEFMQFHPTCLFHPKERSFLISEAVRGEGAVIKNTAGIAFMDQHHKLGSLAPRDVVARAIDFELKRTGAQYAYLDARPIGAEKIKQLFPNIYNRCFDLGIDMTKDMLPIVPAAHYSCGGVVVDERGETNVCGLFAIGEVACTGLHGANRLASNSLLEALVYAKIVGEQELEAKTARLHINVPPWHVRSAAPADERVVLSHAWDEIRRLMWHYVGIVRSDVRLKRALARISVLRQEVESFYWDYELDRDLIEVRNIAEVANLTIKCAMARKESRGIHFNIDYPEMDDVFCNKDTILR